MPPSPRIVFFSNRDSYVDGDTCHYDGANGRLIEALLAHYPDMTVVTYADPVHRPYYTLPLRPARLIALPFQNFFGPGLRYMGWVARLLRQLEREHDLLIIQLPFKSFLAPLLLRKPVIYHICSNLRTAAANPVKYRGWRRWIARSYAEIFHGCHQLYLRRRKGRLVANGQELAELYGRHRTETVVSSSIFESEVLFPDQLRPRGSQFNILFVGRPSLEKGFDTLLAVLSDLFPRYPQARLTCIGFDRSTFERTWKQAAPEAVLERITFAGELPFSEQLLAHYRDGDALVLPSRSEGTPRVLVEARAQGCPVVASRVGGIPFSVNDGYDGLLFEVGDTNGMVRHLRRLIEDIPYWQKLRENGLRTVRERMTLDVFSQKFVDTIKHLLKHE